MKSKRKFEVLKPKSWQKEQQAYLPNYLNKRSTLMILHVNLNFENVCLSVLPEGIVWEGEMFVILCLWGSFLVKSTALVAYCTVKGYFRIKGYI